MPKRFSLEIGGQATKLPCSRFLRRCAHHGYRACSHSGPLKYISDARVRFAPHSAPPQEWLENLINRLLIAGLPQQVGNMDRKLPFDRFPPAFGSTPGCRRTASSRVVRDHCPTRVERPSMRPAGACLRRPSPRYAVRRVPGEKFRTECVRMSDTVIGSADGGCSEKFPLQAVASRRASSAAKASRPRPHAPRRRRPATSIARSSHIVASREHHSHLNIACKFVSRPSILCSGSTVAASAATVAGAVKISAFLGECK